MKVLNAIFLLFIFCFCAGIQATDIDEAERIVFAIDTSASMELKDTNLKIKQAIILWTKYLAPKNISVGVVQLKQHKEATLVNLQNDLALQEIIEALPDTAQGGPCLHCGLQRITQLLEMPSDKDVVLVLMEETSIASPHDTPQYALEQIKPSFRIHTLAISEVASPNLEQLAVATNGSTDYEQEVSVSSLILSFSLLPASKRYVIIANDECDGGEDECLIKYQVDNQLRSDKSVLTTFVCPTMNSNETDNITFNDEFDFNWDAEIHCWTSLSDNNQKEEWELKLSVVSPVSVLIILNNETNYPKLQCEVNTGADTFDPTSEDIIISAVLDPQFNHQNYNISAIIKSQDGTTEGLELITNDESLFSACVNLSKPIGRHSVICIAHHTKDQANLIVAKAPSFKVDKWPLVWPVSNSKCDATSIATAKNTSSKSVSTQPTDLLISPNMPNNSTNQTKDYNDSKSTPEEHDISQPMSTFIPNIIPDSVEENETVSNRTMHNVRNISPTEAHFNGTQITIVVVSAIIIAEVVFIMYKCSSKSKEIEQENNNLIAYSITYKDDFELRHNAMNYKYDDDEI